MSEEVQSFEVSQAALTLEEVRVALVMLLDPKIGEALLVGNVFEPRVQDHVNQLQVRVSMQTTRVVGLRKNERALPAISGEARARTVVGTVNVEQPIEW